LSREKVNPFERALAGEEDEASAEEWGCVPFLFSSFCYLIAWRAVWRAVKKTEVLSSAHREAPGAQEEAGDGGSLNWADVEDDAEEEAEEEEEESAAAKKKRLKKERQKATREAEAAAAAAAYAAAEESPSEGEESEEEAPAPKKVPLVRALQQPSQTLSKKELQARTGPYPTADRSRKAVAASVRRAGRKSGGVVLRSDGRVTPGAEEGGGDGRARGGAQRGRPRGRPAAAGGGGGRRARWQMPALRNRLVGDRARSTARRAASGSGGPCLSGGGRGAGRGERGGEEEAAEEGAAEGREGRVRSHCRFRK
jgi:hypothetical protein